MGTCLGPYQILAPIGAGGMGEVYRAHDPRMGRDVAIKISAERFSDRFSWEVRAVGHRSTGFSGANSPRNKANFEAWLRSSRAARVGGKALSVFYSGLWTLSFRNLPALRITPLNDHAWPDSAGVLAQSLQPSATITEACLHMRWRKTEIC